MTAKGTEGDLRLRLGGLAAPTTTASLPRELSIAPFQRFAEQLLRSDTQALYLEQLERNASDEEGATSGLGFLTMVNDYGAALAWKLRRDDQQEDRAWVTTMVRLPVSQ